MANDEGPAPPDDLPAARVDRWTAQLAPTLAAGRQVGAVGPTADRALVAHAARFVRVVGRAPTSVVDLGSGAGLPGLVLALAWPSTTVVLVESSSRRAQVLERAVAELGLAGRVTVLAARAEDVARDPQHRGRHPVVTARSFGPPAVTAECAVGLLAAGGRLLVSEPPGSRGERWVPIGLVQLGLVLHGVEAGIATLVLVEPVADRWPRRPGIPAKRPLFR